MGKTVKIGSTFSQIWLSVADKNRPITRRRLCTESSQLTKS